jgi:hypothetical protein
VPEDDLEVPDPDVPAAFEAVAFFEPLLFFEPDVDDDLAELAVDLEERLDELLAVLVPSWAPADDDLPVFDDFLRGATDLATASAVPTAAPVTAPSRISPTTPFAFS